ncbi:MAG: peptide-methionine (S)-S-oxide reductase MsrA [Patescibacteria group bacterium]
MTNEFAVLGGGCFWCTESIFKELKGVASVMPGYAGGERPEPTYEQVCSGDTGHAEVIRVEFDPSLISFSDILQVFFATHDPTTLNRQGNDVGTQYRSLILYADEKQKADAEAVIAELKAAGGYGGREVVTELKPLETFWEAESYHRDYYTKNRGENPYCQLVIDPKLAKFRAKFRSLLKSA